MARTLSLHCREHRFDPWSGTSCSPQGCEELDTTEPLHFDFSLSSIGEGNGTPPQCSCLENPRDGGAWWAAVFGVTQSRTRLKRLSGSSSRNEDPRGHTREAQQKMTVSSGWTETTGIYMISVLLIV